MLRLKGRGNIPMRVRRGLSSPVRVAPAVDWTRDYSDWTDALLLALPESHLATVDPLAMNLLVARQLRSLADLEIAPYQDRVNALALCLRAFEVFGAESDLLRGILNDALALLVARVCCAAHRSMLSQCGHPCHDASNQSSVY
jgi:hypothetical protein